MRQECTLVRALKGGSEVVYSREAGMVRPVQWPITEVCMLVASTWTVDLDSIMQVTIFNTYYQAHH